MSDPTADAALSLPVPVLTAEERERATALFRVAKRMNPSLDSDDAFAVRCIEIAAHPDTAFAHKLLEVVRGMDRETTRAVLDACEQWTRGSGVDMHCVKNLTAKALLAEAQRRVEAKR